MPNTLNHDSPDSCASRRMWPTSLMPPARAKPGFSGVGTKLSCAMALVYPAQRNGIEQLSPILHLFVARQQAGPKGMPLMCQLLCRRRSPFVGTPGNMRSTNWTTHSRLTPFFSPSVIASAATSIKDEMKKLPTCHSAPATAYLAVPYKPCTTCHAVHSMKWCTVNPNPLEQI